MKTQTIAEKVKSLEQSDTIPSDVYYIIRLDGVGFTKNIEDMGFSRPLDYELHQLMSNTTKYLMDNPKAKLKILAAHTQSDEISLLIDKEDMTHNRRQEKLLSITAGLASAYFSMYMRSVVVFDARISLAFGKQDVIDYFNVRMEDAYRNCINNYLYWTLRKNGKSAKVATALMQPLNQKQRIEMLANLNIDINVLEIWMKYGTLFMWEEIPHTGFNPITNQEVITTRRRIFSLSASKNIVDNLI